MSRRHCWWRIGTKRGKNLKGSLLRAFLLLLAIGLVATYGVRGSLNPAHVTTVSAADLQIVLSSNDTDTLQFQVALGQPCADALAPGDSCVATVKVENKGSTDSPVGMPEITVSGTLDTCSGDDPANPGAGAHNLSVSFRDPQPTGMLLKAGASETFDVVFTLSSAMGNACQGKQASIEVFVATGAFAQGPGAAGPSATTEPATQAPEASSPPAEAQPAEEAPAAQAPPLVPTFTPIPAPTETPVPATPAPTASVTVQTQVVTPTPSPTPTQELLPPATAEPRTFLDNQPGFSEISTNISVVGTNLFLAVLSLLTLLVATTVFNSTLEENARDIEAVARKITDSPRVAPMAAALGWLSEEEAGGTHALLNWLKPILIVLITAAIYAVIDPNFGFNNDTLVLITALVAGLAMATFLYEGGQVLWSTRRYGTPAAMRVYPVAILIALGSVVLTRITNLHPGIIFGFVTAAAIFPRGAMSKREKGMIILVPLVGLMIVSFVAFALIDPLRRLSQDNSGVLYALPETIAIALFVGGAESALLILLPIRFNDGERIWEWNKLLWVILAVPATFAFFHIIIANDDGVRSITNNTNAMTLIIVCLVVLVISFATWLFFKLRDMGED